MSLACTVRGCHLPLTRRERAFTCPAFHSFDISRSGYVNLLQPDHRRSLDAGDSSATVSARRALLDAGFGLVLEQTLLHLLEHAALPTDPSIADLGAGEGHFLAAIHARTAGTAFGLDLSVPAIEAAAKRHPTLTWIVANADRRLPLLDASLDLVLSIDGRRNPSECARVLKPGGTLLMAVPGPADLRELREHVLGAAHETERLPALVEEHAAAFEPAEATGAHGRVRLDAPALAALALATYRCARGREKEALSRIATLDVTTSHIVIRFTRR